MSKVQKIHCVGFLILLHTFTKFDQVPGFINLPDFETAGSARPGNEACKGHGQEETGPSLTQKSTRHLFLVYRLVGTCDVIEGSLEVKPRTIWRLENHKKKSIDTNQKESPNWSQHSASRQPAWPNGSLGGHKAGDQGGSERPAKKNT